jgi:hypothetical protein
MIAFRSSNKWTELMVHVLSLEGISDCLIDQNVNLSLDLS